METLLSQLFAEFGVTISDCVRGGMAYGTVYAHLHGTRAISAESALDYERVTHIPRHRLRPDLWHG